MLVLPPFGNPYELTEIEERLGLAPDDVSLLFARACILDSLGRNNEARDAYIEVIKRDAAHIGALGNLGTLLYNAGAARPCSRRRLPAFRACLHTRFARAQ
jgi:Tfp pilus assembly protein PilF